MKPFKVGDRVSFAGMKGTVKWSSEVQLTINWDHETQGFTRFEPDGKLFPQQTRPLLKHLRKKKRREFWMRRPHYQGTITFNESHKGSLRWITKEAPNDKTGWIKVREVK